MRRLVVALSLFTATANCGNPTAEWTALGFNGRGCDASVTSSVELADGRLILGGWFAACDDVQAMGLVVFDPQTGLFSAPANDLIRGSVNDLALLGDTLFVAGDSMAPQGIGGIWGFAQLDLVTGQWSTPITELAVGIVDALAAVGGEIYLQSSLGLIRYDPATQMTTEILAPPTSINALEADGDQLLAGGGFIEIGGVSASRIARYDPQMGTWNSLGASLNDIVFAIATDVDAIYVGGDFSTVNGLPTDGVARFDRVGATWQALGMGTFTGGSVRGLASVDSHVYASGVFTSMDGVLANNIARYDVMSNSWHALGDGLTGTVTGASGFMRAHDNQVYVGGSFQHAGGETQNSVARLIAASGQWQPLGAGSVAAANGSVDEILTSGGQTYLVGRFTEIGGVSAVKIAQMDCGSLQISPLGGIADHQIIGAVNAAVVHGGWLYIGGNFLGVGGVPANRLARYHLSSGQWEAVGATLDGDVQELYADGNDLYVAGFFDNAGTLPARRVARLDLTTLQWNTLGSGPTNGTNGFVEAFHRVGDGIYIGGSYQEAGGQSAGGFAFYLPQTDTWIYPGGDFNDFILSMEDIDGGLYVGGNFQFLDGTPVVGIARLDLATGVWSAPSGPGQSFFTSVSSLHKRNGQLLVGGMFASMAGVPLNGIGSLDPETQQWTAFGQGVEFPGVAFLPSGTVSDTAVCGDQIIIGGGFQRADGQASSNLAYLRLPGPIFVDDFE